MSGKRGGVGSGVVVLGLGLIEAGSWSKVEGYRWRVRASLVRSGRVLLML